MSRLLISFGPYLTRRPRIQSVQRLASKSAFHNAAKTGYEDAAKYHENRPSYTNATTARFLRWARKCMRGNSIRVLELGAGTGKWTEAVIEHLRRHTLPTVPQELHLMNTDLVSTPLQAAAQGSTTIPAAQADKLCRTLTYIKIDYCATEPAGMGRALSDRSRNFSIDGSQCCVRYETAYVSVQGAAAGLLPWCSRGQVDLVVAAYAFHWFDSPRDITAIRSILRPGGIFVCLWNTRDGSASPAMASLERYIDSLYPADVPRYYSYEWEQRLLSFDGFVPAIEVEGRAQWASGPRGGPSSRWHQRTTEVLSLDAAVGRVASLSVVASLSTDKKQQIEAETRRHMEALDSPVGGAVGGLSDTFGAPDTSSQHSFEQHCLSRQGRQVVLPHHTEMYVWLAV